MQTRLLLISLFLCIDTASAQLVVDTLLTWEGYGRESTCRIRIYHSAPDEKRVLTVVLGELAENGGASSLDDTQHLVEIAARRFNLDPEAVFWVFHWGGFSFPGAEKAKKEVFFRATFRRTDNGSVGPPFWRLINRQTVEKYTDRIFR